MYAQQTKNILLLQPYFLRHVDETLLLINQGDGHHSTYAGILRHTMILENLI